MVRSLIILFFFQYGWIWPVLAFAKMVEAQSVEFDLGNGETVQISGFTPEEVASFSQETIDEIKLEHRRRKFFADTYRDKLYVDIRGNVGFVTTPERRYVGQKPLIDFLNQEAIRGELVFTREQDRQLKVIVEDFEAAIRKYESREKFDAIEQRYADAGENLTLPDAKKLQAELAQLEKARVDQLELANRQAAGALEGFLFPHQLDRMRQLVIRRYIRETGLLGRMTNGKLGESLDVSEAQKKQMLKTADALVPQLLEDSKKLKSESFEDLMSVLEPWQSKRLNNLLIRDVTQSNLPIGVLYAQLDTDSLANVDEIARSHPWPRYMPLCLPNEFLLDHFGRYQSEEIKPKDDPKRYIFAMTNGIFGIFGVSHIRNERTPIRQPNYLKELRITPKQLQEIKKLRKSWDNFQGRTEKELGNGRSTKEFKKLVAQIKKERHDLASKIRLRIEELLSKQQIKTLEQIMTSIRVDRVGLLASLIESELGDQIELSQTQKEKLLTKAIKVRRNLVEKSSLIEAAFEAELLKTLSRDQRIIYREQVGDRVEGVIGNLDLLAKQSTSKYATVYAKYNSSDLKIDFSNLKIDK